MRPTLPRIPRAAVNKLSVEWITKLIACVKYAMDYPKGDGKTTYRSDDAIHAIRQSANATGSTGGDSYKGYFKVIQDGDDRIVIVDGFIHPAYHTHAGQVQINEFLKNVNAASLTITADAFIYIESVIAGGAYPGASATIMQSPTYPTYEEGKEKTLISRVTFADDKITGFSRENVPLHILVIGGCG
jgi:hypothetical protein